MHQLKIYLDANTTVKSKNNEIAQELPSNATIHVEKKVGRFTLKFAKTTLKTSPPKPTFANLLSGKYKLSPITLSSHSTSSSSGTAKTYVTKYFPNGGDYDSPADYRWMEDEEKPF
jgi:hypothetical protein